MSNLSSYAGTLLKHTKEASVDDLNRIRKKLFYFANLMVCIESSSILERLLFFPSFFSFFNKLRLDIHYKCWMMIVVVNQNILTTLLLLEMYVSLFSVFSFLFFLSFFSSFWMKTKSTYFSIFSFAHYFNTSLRLFLSFHVRK